MPDTAATDGDPGPADPADPAGATSEADATDPAPATAAARWDEVLTELERRLARWHAALEGGVPAPDDIAWPKEIGPCPDALAERARRIDAAQQDVMGRLLMRREVLGALLRAGAAGPGSSTGSGRAAPPPLFVDQHS